MKRSESRGRPPETWGRNNKRGSRAAGHRGRCSAHASLARGKSRLIERRWLVAGPSPAGTRTSAVETKSVWPILQEPAASPAQLADRPEREPPRDRALRKAHEARRCQSSAQRLAISQLDDRDSVISVSGN